MKKSIVLLLAVVALLGSYSFAQGVPVILSPPPKLQFFDNSGRPLAFGCVFTYSSGTNSPLNTYTDNTGTILNQNPVPLNAGGFAGGGSSGIWLIAGTAYTMKVVSAGGTNCAFGSTLYTVNGVGGGGATLTTVITCPPCVFTIQAQVQLFEITLTADVVAQTLTAVGIIPPVIVIFQITQDVVGGHSFTWPSNVIGGALVGQGAGQVTTQMFVWNGVNATAIGPAVTGDGPQLSTGDINTQGNITATGNVQATAFITNTANPAATGVVRLADGDTLCWRNRAGTADVCFSKDGSDNMIYPNGLSLGGGTVLASTNQSGTGDLCLTTNCQLITPAINGVVITGTPSAGQALVATSSTAASWATAGLSAPQRTELASPVTLTTNTQTTVISQTVTFPPGAGTYRADVRYGLWITAGPNICQAQVIETTNGRAYALSGQDANGDGFIALSGSEVSKYTYGAGGSLLFTLQVICNSTQTATPNSAAYPGWSPAEPSYLEVMPVLSN